MEDSVSTETKIALAKNVLEMWLNTNYQQRLHHQVHSRIGSDKSILEKHAAEIARAEQAIVFLKAQIKELLEANHNGST